jgi:CubicO group peptidase (beta-lactamase class C family)
VFEIGSVTMTAALLAEFIARGEVALDDPIAKLLPPRGDKVIALTLKQRGAVLKDERRPDTAGDH